MWSEFDFHFWAELIDSTANLCQSLERGSGTSPRRELDLFMEPSNIDAAFVTATAAHEGPLASGREIR